MLAGWCNGIEKSPACSHPIDGQGLDMPSELVQAMLVTHAVLDELRVPTALMGGLAVTAWDRIRATEDVDFLIGVDSMDADSLLRSLQERGYIPKKYPAVTDFDGEHVMQLRYPPPGKFYDLQVDLFLAESEYHRAALARRVPFTLPDGKTVVPVVSCEDLIIFKLRADRPVDRGDIIGLLEAHRDSLDYAYLRQWVTPPALCEMWRDCWKQAFPGDADPLDVLPNE